MCPCERRETKGVHEYGAYLKRKCYRDRERGVLLSRGGRERDGFRHIDPPAAVW